MCPTRWRALAAEYDVEVGADATLFTLTTLARFADRGAQAAVRHPDGAVDARGRTSIASASFGSIGCGS